MRSTFLLLIAAICMVSCSTPANFTEESKSEKLIALSGEEVTFKDVLIKHKGKMIVIDVWATWCKDCIVRLPNLKELQKDFPDVSFVFLSQDYRQENWKRGIQRYGLIGDHYFMPQKKKGPLGEFLNLWWIPRYVVVDELGKIQLFKATKITDKNIRKALKK